VAHFSRTDQRSFLVGCEAPFCCRCLHFCYGFFSFGVFLSGDFRGRSRPIPFAVRPPQQRVFGPAPKPFGFLHHRRFGLFVKCFSSDLWRTPCDGPLFGSIQQHASQLGVVFIRFLFPPHMTA